MFRMEWLETGASLHMKPRSLSTKQGLGGQQSHEEALFRGELSTLGVGGRKRTRKVAAESEKCRAQNTGWRAGSLKRQTLLSHSSNYLPGQLSEASLSLES